MTEITSDNNNYFLVHKDSFSSGQIDSKLWLCEQLELLNIESNEINIYGGWYGLTAFLLLSRKKFKVKKIRSYDIDPNCELIADMINQNWVWKGWQFKAETKDCNTISSTADLIINTSTEHFSSMLWWENISPGTIVVLQGNNMKHHEDHYSCVDSLEQFVSKFPVSELLYKGEMTFKYDTWGFSRYMIIGIK